MRIAPVGVTGVNKAPRSLGWRVPPAPRPLTGYVR